MGFMTYISGAGLGENPNQLEQTNHFCLRVHGIGSPCSVVVRLQLHPWLDMLHQLPPLSH